MYPLLLGHLLGMVISVRLEGQASFYIFGYLGENLAIFFNNFFEI
jgi:hypothetical protein